MAGFEWDKFYTLLKNDMKNICTVGRYTQPKESQYPYLDIALKDNSGGDYDLENNENSQSPMIELTSYCNNYNDGICYEISMKAKSFMLEYGFKCIAGPMKIDNTDPAVVRWIARYKRVFGNGDKLEKIC